MFQAATSFGAGIFAAHQLSGCQLPACGIQETSTSRPVPFKLSVHIHTASGPALCDTSRMGGMARLRPRFVVGFGRQEKETEDGDFHASQPSCMPVKSLSRNQEFELTGAPHEQHDGSGSWCFGDTVTFAGHVKDILREGVRVRLCARSDVCLGPLHVEFARMQDLGEAVIDLRSQVLPACSPISASRGHRKSCGEMGIYVANSPFHVWETPALVVPLTTVRNTPRNGVKVDVVARAAVSFSLNTDPSTLLREADAAERPVVEKMVDRVAQLVQHSIGALSCHDMGCDDDWEPPPHPKATYSSDRPLFRNPANDEPEAEAAPNIAVPAAADWAFKL